MRSLPIRPELLRKLADELRADPALALALRAVPIQTLRGLASLSPEEARELSESDVAGAVEAMAPAGPSAAPALNVQTTTATSNGSTSRSAAAPVRGPLAQQDRPAPRQAATGTCLDSAVRKVTQRASADGSFARELSASPVQAVRHAPFLNPEEKALLTHTAANWASHLSDQRWSRVLAAPPVDATPAVHTLAAINRRTANHASHVVQPGESLGSIAARYTGDPEAWVQLRDANGLTGASRPGERLVLPAGWAGHFGNVTISASELQAHVNRRGPPGEPASPDTRMKQPGTSGAYAGGLGATLNNPGPFAPADLRAIAVSLATQLENAGVQGFSLVLRQGGVLVPGCDISFSYARGPENSNPHKWSSNTRMMTGSLSKFITSVGLLQMLNIMGMSPSDTVHQWLPGYWFGTTGYALESLQFGDLLRHQSGFSCVIDKLPNITGALTEFMTLKAVIQSNMLQESSFGSFNPGAPMCYSDANYEMIRILMAGLLGDTRSLESSTDDALWDAVTIASYTLYINSYVLTLSGSVANAELTSSVDSALVYLQGTDFHGVDTGNQSRYAGSSGWYLSVNDVLNVASAFRRRGLLNPFSFDKPPPDPNAWFAPQNVLGNYYGIDYASKISNDVSCNDGTGYIYYSKNGSVPFQTHWPNGKPSGFYTNMNTYLWFLPNDIEIALFVNSRIGPTEFPTTPGDTILPEKYDARTLLYFAIQPYFPNTLITPCTINYGTPCPKC